MLPVDQTTVVTFPIIKRLGEAFNVTLENNVTAICHANGSGFRTDEWRDYEFNLIVINLLMKIN